MPMTAPFRRRADNDATNGPILYSDVHADDAAALTFCAATGVDLTYVDLRGRNLDGADVSGLIAPNSDLRGASCRNWTADRFVNGRICELSASRLQNSVIAGTLTHINIECTQPFRVRARAAANTRLRGCNWSLCDNVIVLPVRDDDVGRVVVLRNGTGWYVHVGGRGVFTEAQARTFAANRPAYAAALAYLDSAEYAARKAAIEAGP